MSLWPHTVCGLALEAALDGRLLLLVRADYSYGLYSYGLYSYGPTLEAALDGRLLLLVRAP